MGHNPCAHFYCICVHTKVSLVLSRTYVFFRPSVLVFELDFVYSFRVASAVGQCGEDIDSFLAKTGMGSCFPSKTP